MTIQFVIFITKWIIDKSKKQLILISNVYFVKHCTIEIPMQEYRGYILRISRILGIYNFE